VNNLWKINHGYDYMVEVILRNMKEVEEFTEKLQKDYGVLSVSSFYIVRDMKREGESRGQGQNQIWDAPSATTGSGCRTGYHLHGRHPAAIHFSAFERGLHLYS